MKEQLRAAVTRAAERLRPAGAFVRAHRFWVECAAVTIVGVLVAFALGGAALGRARVLESRAAHLEAAAASLDRFRADLQPASPAESLAWRESAQTLAALGGDDAGALPVARLVARRAAEVGIGGLRVRLLAADSVTNLESAAVGAWTMEPSGEGLTVEFEGGVADVVGLLGALPPQASLERLVLEPRGEVLAARMVLLTRRIERTE